ncbi:MAG: hypothetical protein AAFN74_04480 [Myxococcota bacterium]
MSRCGALCSLLFFLSVGCGVGPESNFTLGLELDRCDGTFPVCQTTAGCILTPDRYLEGSFPGARQFIVPSLAEAVITVDIFFQTQVATGIDTEILWSEPGCFDAYQFRSDGRDIFFEAGNDRILSVSQQVFLDGDHLVEVFSDAVADYLLRVRVD